MPFPARTPWPGVELRHLVALQAVVAAGSFNGAAARLGYTQSAVSAQIRALERMIGVRVLDRSRGAREIGLTREGAIVLRYATEIVARFEAAAGHLVAGDGPPAGELRVGSFRSASLALAAPALARLAAKHPELQVALVELADETALLDLLADGSVTLAFAIAPVPPGFASAVLRREGFVAVVARDDELAGRGELCLRDLASRRVLVDGTHHGGRLGRSALDHGAASVSVVDDKTVVAALGAAGAGVALLPELAYVPVGDAAVLPLRGELPERTIALAWKAERLRTAGTQRFVKAVTAVAHAQRARDVVRSFAAG
ncbi:MAG TPA: LysR family transcriptional regulator [Gaiellaceae bacterium]|nr:LysR family transcriptional regulator [Gaiellaceae bacterium]